MLIVGYMGHKIKEYASEHPDMKFYFAEQEKRLGLGHAIYSAKPFVKPGEPVLIIYGDTIFIGDISAGAKSKRDACIGVKMVDDPRRFGIVEMDGDRIVKLVEKPDVEKPLPAIVGVNFINNSKLMFDCIQELIDRDIRTKGEYQLTDAFQLMVEHGAYMTTFPLEGWYDCGKPETLLETNRYLLDQKSRIAPTENSVIIPPVHIEAGAEVKNSIIGPYVSIAKGAKITASIISDSILNKDCVVKNAQLAQSLIGENAIVEDIVEKLNVGDNSEIRFNG